MLEVYGKILLISSLLFSLVLSLALLTKEPMVWPDESAFASVAREIAQGEGVFRTFEYPPLPFYLTAGTFKIFGFSIASQRLLSLSAAGLFLGIFYLLTRLVVKAPFACLTLSLLVLDFTFLKGAKVGRPEIFLLCLGASALYLLVKKKQSPSVSLTTGLMGGLAFLTHPAAAVFLSSTVLTFVVYLKKKVFASGSFYLFLVSIFVLPFLAFKLNLLDYGTSAAARLAVGSGQESWIVTVFQSQPWQLKLSYLGYFVITGLFFMFTLLKREKPYLILSGILFISWAAAIFARMFWYYLLPLPFVYLAGGVLLEQTIARWKRGFIYILTIMVLIGFLNVWLNLKVWAMMGGEKYSYDKLTAEVLRIVPPGESVFLSTIPDLYYGFKSNRPSDATYEFASSAIPREEYLKWMDNSDYVVYNGSLDAQFFPDLLVRYIELNKEKITLVGGQDQFNVYVIELKSGDKRQHP